MMAWGAVHDELLATIGSQAMRRLIRRFGGRVIRVPVALVPAGRIERTQQLLRTLDQHSYREAATIEGVRTSTLVRMVKRQKVT